MSDFLTIVRAVYSGLSRRKVAASHGVSRNTVSLYLRKARDQGWLTLKDLDAVDDTAVAQSLQQIAAPSRDATVKMPDYDYVHAELAKAHVTLKLLWCFLQVGNPQECKEKSPVGGGEKWVMH